jgi:signal transduction histidine kinase
VHVYPMLETDQVRLEIVHPLLPVMGNTALLTQAISNLLGNAVKFVQPGTRPEVRVWTQPSGTGWVRFSVQDKGIGIAPEYAERIWRIFERLHHEHEYPGTGIGLSVVKKAVERMGGHVGAESHVGKGSVFWFELPGP